MCQIPLLVMFLGNQLCRRHAPAAIIGSIDVGDRQIPCSVLQRLLEDVNIVAFNLPTRVCDQCIAVEDHPGSAEIKRRFLKIHDERRCRYAEGFSTIGGARG